MNKKKVAKRVYKATLESFKANLNEGKYESIGGARKAAAYLPDGDKVAALKLVDKRFDSDGADVAKKVDKRAAKEEKPAKRNIKKTQAAVSAPVKLGVLKKKPGRPRKVVAETVLPPLETVLTAPVAAPKNKPGRPRKNPLPVVSVAPEAALVRTPAPEKTKRRKSEEVGSEPLDKIGLIGRVMGGLEAALRILEKANSLSNGMLNTTGYQDIAETATSAIRALKPHVTQLAHQDSPPPPVISSNGQADRPFDQALLDAAAQSAGIPLPGDDLVQ